MTALDCFILNVFLKHLYFLGEFQIGGGSQGTDLINWLHNDLEGKKNPEKKARIMCSRKTRMGQGPCQSLCPSFGSEGRVKERERKKKWSDGDEDRGLCFASQNCRWRVMIMQQQTEGREG